MTTAQSAVIRAIAVVGAMLCIAGLLIVIAEGGSSPSPAGVLVGGVGVLTLCAVATAWATLAPAAERPKDSRHPGRNLAIGVAVLFVLVMATGVIDVFVLG